MTDWYDVVYDVDLNDWQPWGTVNPDPFDSEVIPVSVGDIVFMVENEEWIGCLAKVLEIHRWEDGTWRAKVDPRYDS